MSIKYGQLDPQQRLDVARGEKLGSDRLLIVERAITGSGEFIGLRLTIPESDKITLVFADQKAMPGFRYGEEFIPDIGETVRYADELSQLRDELAIVEAARNSYQRIARESVEELAQRDAEVVRQFVESQTVCSDCHLDETCCRPLLRAARDALSVAPQPAARHDQGDEVLNIAERYHWLIGYMASARTDLDDEIVEACRNDDPRELDAYIATALTQSPKGEEE